MPYSVYLALFSFPPTDFKIQTGEDTEISCLFKNSSDGEDFALAEKPFSEKEDWKPATSDGGISVKVLLFEEEPEDCRYKDPFKDPALVQNYTDYFASKWVKIVSAGCIGQHKD